MARQPRFQYHGAVYHVMARGNGGDEVFVTDDDRKAFLHRLGQVCESHGWKIHAWVLMGNHFHLLLETPEANLVSGMKWLLSAYSQGWNRARMRRGHVFQGRYKAVPVNSSDAAPYYFKCLADYIHLNPTRAGLAGGGHGPLLNYPWSSLRSHHKGNGPGWLESGRILRAFKLAEDGRGWRAYVAWLEARTANDAGKIGDEAMEAIRRGWYLGKESFKDKLLKMLEKPTVRAGSGNRRAAGVERDHGEKEAMRILQEGSRLTPFNGEWCRAGKGTSASGGSFAGEATNQSNLKVELRTPPSEVGPSNWIGGRTLKHPGNSCAIPYRRLRKRHRMPRPASASTEGSGMGVIDSMFHEKP